MTRYTPLYLQAGSYAASVDRRFVQALAPVAAATGVAVTAASGMNLNIAPGAVAVPSQNNTGSTMCVSDAVEQVVIAAAPASGNNRIDVVTCHPRGNDLDGGANTDFIFDVIAGAVAAAGSEVAPAVPAGQVAIAQIRVTGGLAALTAANIIDARPAMLSPLGEPAVAAGSPLVARTDIEGETWVAKGGVNGGAWKRAKEVLVCSYFRNTAMNLGGTINHDGKTFDDYGLYAAGVFTAPIAGRWRVVNNITATGSGGNQDIQASLQVGGGGIYTTHGIAVASGWDGTSRCDQSFRLPAGGTVTTTAGGTAIPVRLPGLGITQTWMEAQYLGP